MGTIKHIAEKLAWPLGVVFGYHLGLFNWIPGMDGPKKTGSPIPGK